METKRSIESVIRTYLGDLSVRFVFPSAVASGFWSERSAELMLAESLASRSGSTGAVDLERFVAWDDFKAATLAADRDDRKPSNGAIRSLFSASLLAENAASAASGSALLKELIVPEHSGSYSSFVPSIARLLPALDGLFRRAPQSGSLGADPYFSDLAYIRDRYGAFLQANRLFEAAWDRMAFRPNAASWILFFPELAEDWDQYEAELTSVPGVRIFNIPSLAPSDDPPPPSVVATNGKALRFRTGRDELRNLAASIRSLIDSDAVRPSDIAVSIPRIDDYSERLAQEFRLRDIPLDLRAGKPLAEHSVGRLLQAMAECASSRWSFRSIKDLLLDAAFPWKDERTIRNLIDFGLRYRCVSGYAQDGEDVDVWIRSFDRFRERETGIDLPLGSIRAFYLRLKRNVSGILHASDFEDLRRKLVQFESDFLIEEEMDESIDRVFSRVVAELASLAETQEAIVGLTIRDPFALFMTHLRGIEYVFQQEMPGVRVYNYRVAAGIVPAAHFVLNLTQDSATVRAESVPFLREDRKRLALAQERDLSAAFIQAYSLSGRAVVFHSADRGFSGPSIPHAGLSRPGIVQETAFASARVDENPWELDRAAALGRDNAPRSGAARPVGPSSVQRAARAKSRELEGCSPPLDMRRDPAAAADLLEMIRNRLTRASEGARISPTDLNEFAACPYSWFLRRGLGIREKDTEIATVDQRELGSLYHRVLERLFIWIRETDGRFRAERLVVYKEALARETDAALAEAAVNEGAFQESVYGMLRGRLFASLAAYLDADSTRLDSAAITGAELPLRRPYDECGLALSGVADLVALKNDGTYALVDFKTGLMPRAADLVCDDEGAIGDYQLASYIRMIEASDPGTSGSAPPRVSEARFYSIDYREFRQLLADHPERRSRTGIPVDREEYDASLAAVDDAVQAVAGALGGAHYPVPAPGRRNVCFACRVSTVCRLPFAGGEPS
ncbi:MAG: hypothetical protein A2Z99_15335 [Treponema sp. GWB1_62_6]|nr:MAG: hypothetical protein A2Z99_15335 [Treponema sp. GWB1_62_6]OHE68665.1 MAG: hypothetical protein A2001_06050 [Treponema sp. GWC1_61_84]OHE70357.1 MAG: hypothetical protein A2413_15090 [Treponema sp. RIFOXYC1_FULL_61_9]